MSLPSPSHVLFNVLLWFYLPFIADGLCFTLLFFIRKTACIMFRFEQLYLHGSATQNIKDAYFFDVCIYLRSLLQELVILYWLLTAE